MGCLGGWIWNGRLEGASLVDWMGRCVGANVVHTLTCINGQQCQQIELPCHAVCVTVNPNRWNIYILNMLHPV